MIMNHKKRCINTQTIYSNAMKVNLDFQYGQTPFGHKFRQRLTSLGDSLGLGASLFSSYVYQLIKVPTNNNTS